MTTYDNTFYDYVNSGSTRSAEGLLPHLTRCMDITSILDVGCGQGAWLSVWRALGIKDIRGIDGAHVDKARLLIEPSQFTAANLELGFDLLRRFDIVQSLEVAEHLSKDAAPRFIESLVRHGDIVLFSAAAKGDGGENHINEQDYEYWRKLFAGHGYQPFDYLRSLVINEHAIEPWYRYNVFLYVKSSCINKVPECIRSRKVDDDEPLRDIAPLWWKLRRLVVRLIPVGMATRLAKVKERWILFRRRSRGAS